MIFNRYTTYRPGLFRSSASFRQVDAGADPRRTIGLMRGSPLHDAAYFGTAEHIDILTSSTKQGDTQVELDAQGPYNGLTALHDAVWHGYTDAVASLVSAGARRDLKNSLGPDTTQPRYSLRVNRR